MWKSDDTIRIDTFCQHAKCPGSQNKPQLLLERQHRPKSTVSEPKWLWTRISTQRSPRRSALGFRPWNRCISPCSLDTIQRPKEKRRWPMRMQTVHEHMDQITHVDFIPAKARVTSWSSQDRMVQMKATAVVCWAFHCPKSDLDLVGFILCRTGLGRGWKKMEDSGKHGEEPY